VIDITNEDLKPLADAAAEWVPRRRRGRKCHVSTLYRWATAGCRGIRLETIQVGGTCCTSREALQRFFEALTLARGGPTGRTSGAEQAGVRTAARRHQDSQRAARELEEMGA
jgi:hypothetical protein